MSATLLVLRQQLLFARRNRGALLTQLLFPVVLVVILGGFGYATTRLDDRSRSLDVHVAVTRTAAATAFAEGLRHQGLTIVGVDDVPRALLTDRATVGLDLPADVDARLAAALPVDVVTIDGTAQDRAQRAIVLAAVDEVVLASSPATADRVLPPVEERKAAPDASRDVLAIGVSVLLAMTLLSIFSAASSRFAVAGRQPALEAVLALPLPRRSILIGMAGCDALLGLFSQAVVLGPLVAVAALVNASVGGGAVLGLATAGVLAFAVVSGSLLAAVLGATIGVLDRDRPGRGVGGLVNGAAFGGVAVLSIIGGVEKLRSLLFIPLVGEMILARRATTGIATAADVGLVAAISLVATLLLSKAAIDRFDGAGLAGGTE